MLYFATPLRLTVAQFLLPNSYHKQLRIVLLLFHFHRCSPSDARSSTGDKRKMYCAPGLLHSEMKDSLFIVLLLV